MVLAPGRDTGACLLVVIHRFVAVFLDQLITLGGFEVFAHHFGDQFVEGDLRGPAEFGLGLGGVAEQGFDFGGAEVAGATATMGLSGCPGFRPSPE